MSLDSALILAFVFVFIIAFILISSYICFSMAFGRKKIEISPYASLESKKAESYRETSRALIDELISLPFEEVKIKSFDGLALTGRYYHIKDGAPLEIQCHGYRSTPLRDFSGGALLAIKNGHNVFLPYLRAHCESEGKIISFGQLESRDLLDWTSYFINRLGENTQIVYVGLSMGAGTVLMASGLSLPKNVKCIIADCPFGSAKEIIKHVIKGMKLPPSLCYPFVRLGAMIYGHFDPNKSTPKEAVKNAKLPILIIHGESDSFVPPIMSEHIYNNCKEIAMRETFPNATHGTSYLIDTQRYENVVNSFLKSSLSDK